MKDKIYLFDNNINLHQNKTNLYSSIFIYIIYENTLFTKFQLVQISFIFNINISIIDIIIDDIFFHLNNHINIFHLNILKLFKYNENMNEYKVI